MFSLDGIGDWSIVEADVMNLRAVGPEVDNQRFCLVKRYSDAGCSGYLSIEAVGQIEMQLVM